MKCEFLYRVPSLARKVEDDLRERECLEIDLGITEPMVGADGQNELLRPIPMRLIHGNPKRSSILSGRFWLK